MGLYIGGMSEERSEAEPIRVFLLDDHEVVGRGIKDLLESQGDILVVGVGLAQEASRRIPALRPDVAILDGRLPDGSGIDVCRIRSQDPTINALILTSYDDDDALFSAIMAGASVRPQADPGFGPDRHRPPGGGRAVDAGPGGHGAGARTAAVRRRPTLRWIS